MAERNLVRLTTSLPALGLASLIAVAAITVQPTPVSATDPSPSPTPSATAAPTATPSPEATPSADPSPTADPTDPPATDPTEPPVTDPTDPATTTVVTTTTTLTRAERIRLRYVKAMRIALRQRHDRYVSGAVGPNRFDCSGLVRYTYRKASLSRRLGGGHSARAMYAWAIRHHKLRRHHPKVGDVVVWGHGRHVGIYIGRGKAISALNPRQDIRVTRLHALGDPLTGFIRTRP